MGFVPGGVRTQRACAPTPPGTKPRYRPLSSAVWTEPAIEREREREFTVVSADVVKVVESLTTDDISETMTFSHETAHFIDIIQLDTN